MLVDASYGRKTKAVILMDTKIEEGVYPQCIENVTPWGGTFLSFLPGHSPAETSGKDLIANIESMIDYLLKGN